MFKVVKLVLYIRANSAKAGPPLGTTLGNIGVNTSNFCKDFNDFTQELPDYFKLKVEIVVAENKNYIFKVFLPSIGFLIYLLKKEEEVITPQGFRATIYYVMLEDVIQLALLKFPNLDLKTSIQIVKGSLLSSKILIK